MTYQNNSGTGDPLRNGILDEINKQSTYYQSQTELFKCATCCNYEGKLKCIKGVFIAFEGANLSDCVLYISGKKCPHCGRIV